MKATTRTAVLCGKESAQKGKAAIELDSTYTNKLAKCVERVLCFHPRVSFMQNI